MSFNRLEAPFGRGGGSTGDNQKGKHEYKGIPPTVKNRETIIQAIEEFEKQRPEFPLQKGSYVASREDPKSYFVRELREDGSAVIGYEDPRSGKDVSKTVPQNVLFDVYRVFEIAAEIEVDKTRKQIKRQQRNAQNN